MSKNPKHVAIPTMTEKAAKQEIPQVFSREQVDGIIQQVSGEYQKQVQEAKTMIQQLREALQSSNTSEIYRRVGMLLDLLKSPELFDKEVINGWKSELLELVDDTKLIRVDQSDPKE